MERHLTNEYNKKFNEETRRTKKPPKTTFTFLGFTLDLIPVGKVLLHVNTPLQPCYAYWADFTRKNIMLLSMYEQCEPPIIRKLLRNPTNFERILFEPYLLEKVLKF